MPITATTTAANTATGLMYCKAVFIKYNAMQVMKNSKVTAVPTARLLVLIALTSNLPFNLLIAGF
jgi:hypothetical protein